MSGCTGSSGATAAAIPSCGLGRLARRASRRPAVEVLAYLDNTMVADHAVRDARSLAALLGDPAATGEA